MVKIFKVNLNRPQIKVLIDPPPLLVDLNILSVDLNLLLVNLNPFFDNVGKTKLFSIQLDKVTASSESDVNYLPYNLMQQQTVVTTPTWFAISDSGCVIVEDFLFCKPIEERTSAIKFCQSKHVVEMSSYNYHRLSSSCYIMVAGITSVYKHLWGRHLQE